MRGYYASDCHNRIVPDADEQSNEPPRRLPSWLQSTPTQPKEKPDPRCPLCGALSYRNDLKRDRLLWTCSQCDHPFRVD